MSTEPKPGAACCAVIVAYNSADSIGFCLDSLFARSQTPISASVVDNSPRDDTAKAVEAYRAAHPGRDIALIRRPENIGFAAGCNLGAKGRSEEYLMFLNPDTALENDAPSILISFLRANPGAKIAGPQIRDSGNRVTRTCRNFPTPFGMFLDATGIDAYVGFYRMTTFDHASTRKVDQVIGACMMMRRDDYEALGGFDERFFIYYEEVDFCKRAVDAGGEVWFCADAAIIHQAGGSAEVPESLPLMPGYLRRSRAEYFAKHYGLIPQFIVCGISICESVVKACVLTVVSWLSSNRSPYRRARRDGFVRLLLEWKRKNPRAHARAAARPDASGPACGPKDE